MTGRTRTAKKATTTPAPAPAKKTPAKRTPAAASRPARKRTPRTPANAERPRLSLVKPPKPLPARDRLFVTDAQIYATHAARTAGLPTHRIREWTDHNDGTATRTLTDGFLHYTHPTRTLTWRATCRMGALHTYILDSPSTAARARVQAASCEELHADLSTVPPLTGNELEALGLLQTPTWAHKDVIGEPATVSLPVPEEPIHRATSSAADTQPIPRDAITAVLAARATDNETPKGHPEP
jgi:hypothetical protein